MAKVRKNGVKESKDARVAVEEPVGRYTLRNSYTGAQKAKKVLGAQRVNSGTAVYATKSGEKGLKEIHSIEGEAILSARGRNENKMTALEKMELIEDGISKKALESFKEKAGLDYDQLAEFLNVARATLINKKGEDKFNRDVSDKIVSLVDIYSYGYEVFEDREKFNQWIFRPNKALGNQAPFNFLHNTFGRQEIKNLIGRIDYGVYS
ncbi:MAG TPA: antitoxin Xre/MbcA/ParS toxin-binding domain-containing protein [Chitinophagaceae bacterium]|nr:antitoxin Xre/MbcA/ParS toxin-binding domain-containing protein [Chitinophagaceae bacterium]